MNIHIEKDVQSKKAILNTLTSFRFIAALLVFVFHVGIWSSYQTGYLGVSFFFILSGFILAYNYSSKLKEINVYQIKYFYIARFSKIYPIHFLTFLLAIPYYFFISLKHEPILYAFQALTNIFLVHSFIPFGNISFNGVSWSLSDEMFFYFIFPFFIYLVLLKPHIIRKVLILSVIWLSLIILFIIIPDNNITTWLAYYFPGVRVIEFFVGALLGIVFLRTREILMKLSKITFSLLEITGLTFLIAMVILSPSIPQNLRFGLIFIPFWSFIIFIFAFQKGLVSDLLSNKILVYFGEISFSFYMVHNLVLSYILFLWKPNINQTLTIICCFIISVLLSSILYHFYEEPMRKRVRSSLTKRGNSSKVIYQEQQNKVLKTRV